MSVTMNAATAHAYGSPNVLSTDQVSVPVPGKAEILIKVHASPVTQGDRRLRAADFPGFTWLPGRLMTGVFRPRNPVGGTVFAGEVVQLGPGVSRFEVGDKVYGLAMHGAWAELLVMPEEGAVAPMPTGLGYDEAAAIPYGAGTALTFLRDMGGLQPGQRVLIVGGTGGVGRYAVQLAAHLGAEVTAVVGSGDAGALARELGAHHVINYRQTDFAASDACYDMVFDTSGAVDFATARGVLTDQGVYLSLYMTLGLLLSMAFTALFGGQRAVTGVAMETQETLGELSALVEQEALRPIIDSRFPLERVADAHVRLERDRPTGSVMVMVH